MSLTLSAMRGLRLLAFAVGDAREPARWSERDQRDVLAARDWLRDRASRLPAGLPDALRLN